MVEGKWSYKGLKKVFFRRKSAEDLNLPTVYCLPNFPFKLFVLVNHKLFQRGLNAIEGNIHSNAGRYIVLRHRKIYFYEIHINVCLGHPAVLVKSIIFIKDYITECEQYKRVVDGKLNFYPIIHCWVSQEENRIPIESIPFWHEHAQLI